MKTCKAFKITDPVEQEKHLHKIVKIEDFGDYCNGHYLHTWDDGRRYLCRCPECDALILVQFSEFHACEDSYYKDYFPVESREEAISLNERYDGWQIERDYEGQRIFRTF